MRGPRPRGARGHKPDLGDASSPPTAPPQGRAANIKRARRAVVRCLQRAGAELPRSGTEPTADGGATHRDPCHDNLVIERMLVDRTHIDVPHLDRSVDSVANGFRAYVLVDSATCAPLACKVLPIGPGHPPPTSLPDYGLDHRRQGSP